MTIDILPVRARPVASVPVASVPAPLICFSHLRWDFVLQRPQHLMDRFAADRRVLFWEEMIPVDHHLPYLEFHASPRTTVQAIRPRVPRHFSPEETLWALSGLLDQMLSVHLGVDVASGILLAVSPWLFGFADLIWWPHLLVGVMEIAVALMTRRDAGALAAVRR
ncbi:SPW repeat protein [uncultured Paracoccus sp.]|uniref:SPW repeat domain-containing protein n=1 Tax=uncultured Paracoccus sp. TaxID=189685 RepID=UPI002639EF58|nr:SPW repeat protein [uncultured Paracoccus sp.]